MITQRNAKFIFFTFIFLFLHSICFARDKYLPYPAVIHIHSNASSGGVYSVARLASLAQNAGIKILVFSDTFLERWEYGLPVFSNLLNISIEENSVVKFGVKKYLKDFKNVKKGFPGLLMLEGVEVTPFYWWSGSLFKKNLTLHDGQKDFLISGLGNYYDYTNLPVVCNRNLFPRLTDLPVLLIVVVLVVLGVFVYKKKKRIRLLGGILCVAGVLFFLNYFPFSVSRYNPYHGYQKYLPYQDLINYVREKGGVIFWSHLATTELSSAVKFATVNFYSPNYPESLVLTFGYTGFAVSLSQDTSCDLILPGGMWDKVLMSYCAGKRKEPAWVIGEADYRSGPIGAEQNILFLSELNPESVYKALRQGRLYVRYYSKNNTDVSLDSFRIEDTQGPEGKTAFIGQEIKINGKPRLVIKGRFKINPIQDLYIQILRDGKIIKESVFGNEGVFILEFQDDFVDAQRKKSYYRLNFVTGGRIVLVTNPIFIEMPNE